ncbi:MAG: hypothetical protein JXC32_03600 [Anaerolineae bacterium]|nr:hypothetical protein [Anaerolineae bacterium]
MNKLRIWRLLVSALVVISLVVNGLLIVVLLRVHSSLRETVRAVRTSLALSESMPIAFDVAVDQLIPIRTEVPIDHVFVIPIDFVYPLDTVVSTYVDIPLLGRQEIAVPVETVIPISYTLEVPLQMTVPISVAYHLQAEIPVEVDVPPQMLEGLEALLSGLDTGLQFPLK